MPGIMERERRAQADRRRASTWSLVYGGVRPRRRAGRRSGDAELVLLDWHESWILYLALAVLLMSCTDALFTLNLLAVGAEELNAIMRALLEHGVGWFLGAKIGLTALSIIALVIGARRMLLGRVRVLSLLWLFFGV